MVQRASDTPPPADERIYLAICEAILERRLHPGTPLQEIALGKFFGVSRTVVHKALQRLAHVGIVSMRPKRVSVVARPSVEETRAVFAARRVIEAAVVPLVAQAISRAQLAELRSMVEREAAAYGRGERAAGARFSVGFHQRLAVLSGNPVLARYLDELVLRTSLIIALYESPAKLAHPQGEHAAIIERIAVRDGRGAAELMLEHLRELEENLDVRDDEQGPSLTAIFGSAATTTP